MVHTERRRVWPTPVRGCREHQTLSNTIDNYIFLLASEFLLAWELGNLWMSEVQREGVNPQ